MCNSKRIVSIGADADGTRIRIGRSAPYPYTYCKNIINNFLQTYARASKIWEHQNHLKPGAGRILLIQLFQDDQIAWEAAKKSIKRIDKGALMGIEGPWDRILGQGDVPIQPNRLLFDIDTLSEHENTGE